jgi:hypothetical protein
MFAAGSVTGVQETPPSLVLYSALWPPEGGPMIAIPAVGLVKWMSIPTLPPPPLEAAVPGTPVWRENVLPPSLVSSTEPLRSSRKPTCAETKLKAWTWSLQLLSATVKIRVKTTPPSVEMRRMQPLALPITTVLASTI